MKLKHFNFSLFILIFSGILNSQDNTVKMLSRAAEIQNIFQYGLTVINDGSNSDTLRYRYFRPQAVASTQKLPLVVFLHGSGERGTDNAAQLKFLDILLSDSDVFIRYPAYYVIPQCPETKRWVEVNWDLDKHKMPEEISVSLKAVKKVIDSLVINGHVDVTRIYLLGLSMGGYGVWDLLSRYPDLFAAAAPICGGGDEEQAYKMTHIPIWAFHGEKDNVVKPARTQNMIDAIRKAGGTPKLTLYPETGHGSWKNAFAEPELLRWIFQQQKKD